MNHLALLIGCLWLLTFAIPCSAKEWHNISPLKTTRAEVLRLLGEPKLNQSNGREYFEVDNETVTFRWHRPDCSSPDSIIEALPISRDALVYQITVTPKVPVPLELLPEVSGIPDKIPDPKALKKRDKAALKELYKSWLSQDISCIGNPGSASSCTMWQKENGFGYHTWKDEITTLHYFPTNEEAKAWEQSHKPCSQ
jgi:hypothetical protein